MSKLFPGKTKPAASTRSVGGMKACAISRCALSESVNPSGSGNMNPRLLSNGSPDNEAKREFHIRVGKNAVFDSRDGRLIEYGLPRDVEVDRPVRPTANHIPRCTVEAGRLAPAFSSV